MGLSKMDHLEPTITPSSPSGQISHEAYNAIIGGLVPTSIELTSLTFDRKPAQSTSQLITRAELRHPTLVGDPLLLNDGQVYRMVEQSVVFAIISSENEAVIVGSATFMIKIKTASNPPDEFWKLFLPRNVKLFTHPAARDLIASLAARAGLVCAPLASVSVTQNVAPVLPNY